MTKGTRVEIIGFPGSEDIFIGCVGTIVRNFRTRDNALLIQLDGESAPLRFDVYEVKTI